MKIQIENISQFTHETCQKTKTKKIIRNLHLSEILDVFQNVIFISHKNVSWYVT